MGVVFYGGGSGEVRGAIQTGWSVMDMKVC